MGMLILSPKVYNNILTLYNAGDLSVVGDVDYRFTEGPYQVKLTTKTVGGPPTTVLWTKNCAIAVGDSTAFLSNTEKSEFTHILTIYPAETKGSFLFLLHLIINHQEIQSYSQNLVRNE